jgi:homospermidine synthase
LVEIKEEIMRINGDNKMTAILNFGENPGLISHYVKYTLERLVAKSSLNKYIETGEYNKVA